MKKLCLFFSLFFVLSPVQAVEFNTEIYCKKISDAVGGSYFIENACTIREMNAKKDIKDLKINNRIETYCKRVSNAVGGSYNLYKSCAIKELEAFKKLNNQ